MPAVALYRDFDLPWTPSLDDERRLRRVLGAVLGLFVAFGIIIPLLPEVPKAPVPIAAPQRVAEFLLAPPERKPEPEPDPVIERPTPVEPPKAEIPVARPVPRTQPQPKADPRRKAATAGLLAMSRQLTELRQLDVDTRTDAQALDAGAGEKTRVDRAVLTARVGEGSGGIAVSATSSGFGGGSNGLKGHDTAKVAAPPSAVPPPSDVERSGQSRKGARTREEVELVFDRNKAAIHALYNQFLERGVELITADDQRINSPAGSRGSAQVGEAILRFGQGQHRQFDSHIGEQQAAVLPIAQMQRKEQHALPPRPGGADYLLLPVPGDPVRHGHSALDAPQIGEL